MGDVGADGVLGEGPKGDGPQQTRLYPLGPEGIHRRLADAGGGPKGHKNVIRIVTEVLLAPLLLRLDLGIAGKALHHGALQLVRLQVQGVDDVVGALVLVAAGGPGLFSAALHRVGEGHRLHHLA